MPLYLLMIAFIFVMSRILIKVTLTIVLVSLCATAEVPYTKVLHNTDSKAKCLDGSSPAAYLHQGQEKNKFLIYFQGGGYCEGASIGEVIESCYLRSKTDLGSSANLPNQLQASGYLSTDPAISKFAGWTKILITYCDGSLHQGSADSSIRYKGAQLFFRGADNVRSHIQWLLNKYGLADAEKVLLTGTSAGGVATFLWANYIRSILVNPRAIYSVVDSGVFINAESPETGVEKMGVHLKTLYKVANVNQMTPVPICNRAFVGEQYKCLFLQHSFTSMQGSMLLVNSEYDSWAIEHIIDMHCLKEGKSGQTLSACNTSQLSNIQVYRRLYLNFIYNFRMFTKNSVWTISCSTHGYAVFNDFYSGEAQRVPEGVGETVRSAVEKYVLEDRRIDIVDQQAWPSNSACS